MNLIDFLKTYSKISNKFIDDFFSLYDLTNKNVFIINLENIAKWLDSKKGDLKETLENSYKLNIDYKSIVKKIAFYFNGNKRQEGTYKYFNTVIPYECNLGALNAGEFLYSFSLNPKLLQPSGAANLSIIEDLEIEQEIYPDYLEIMKNENLEIEVEYFSYSYQILRIMSGFAAPAFINTK